MHLWLSLATLKPTAPLLLKNRAPSSRTHLQFNLSPENSQHPKETHYIHLTHTHPPPRAHTRGPGILSFSFCLLPRWSHQSTGLILLVVWPLTRATVCVCVCVCVCVRALWCVGSVLGTGVCVCGHAVV